MMGAVIKTVVVVIPCCSRTTTECVLGGENCDINVQDS